MSIEGKAATYKYTTHHPLLRVALSLLITFFVLLLIADHPPYNNIDSNHPNFIRVPVVVSAKQTQHSNNVMKSRTSRMTSSRSRLLLQNSLKAEEEQEQEGENLKTQQTATPYSRKFKGTRMTGAGSRSKKNKSIFLEASSEAIKKSKKKEIIPPMKGRLYAKVTDDGELLLLFPSPSISASLDSSSNGTEINASREIEKHGSIISLAMNENYDFFGGNDDKQSSFQATFWKEDDDINSNLCTARSSNNRAKESGYISKTRGKKRHKRHRNGKNAAGFYGHDLYQTQMTEALSSSSSSSTTERSTSSAKTSKRKNRLSQSWFPIEGIYGIFNLPSSAYLILITDSEPIYQSPTGMVQSSIGDEVQQQQQQQHRHHRNHPLINLRRIKSMEIVPIPEHRIMQRGFQQQQLTTKQKLHQRLINAEQSQLQLLRQSFKEHDFYFSCPILARQSDISIQSSEGNDFIIQDVTHTMQRYFEHELKQRKKEEDARETTISKEREILKNAEFIYNDSVLQSLKYEDMVDSLDTWSDCNVVCIDAKPCNWSFLCGEGSKLQIDELLSEVLENMKTFNTLLSRSSSYNNRKFKEASWWTSLLEGKMSEPSGKYLAPDSRFFWNENGVKVLLNAFYNYGSEQKQKYPSPYHYMLDHSMPVTSAFVGVEKNIELLPGSTSGELSNVEYDQLLITRRSKYRAGTRFTKRGADGIGDVANYAETEQICIFCHDTVRHGTLPNRPAQTCNECLELYSHVQTRGSIPLRWSSPTDIKTYRPKVLIGTDPLAQARALRNHLIDQLSKYSSDSSSRETKLEFVNLIDKHSDQGRLGRTFSAVLHAVLALYGSTDLEGCMKQNDTHGLSEDTISHTWFDFHAECRKGRWYRLKNLLDTISPTLDNQGYFHAVMNKTSKPNTMVKSRQDGVVRTNCMDCLDRTNVVQSMFGRYILFKQFSQRIDTQRTRKLPLEYVIGFKRDMLRLPWKNGEASHRLLWADNADAISRLYAGTPALKGDFTRTGKRTKRGALDDGLNSVTRFYLNNFVDADRQKGMDLLTGFANFEVNVDKEDESVATIKKNPVTFVLQSNTMESPLSRESRLNLGWLPGDLEGHLRSAAMTLNESIGEQPSQSLIQGALIDICRRQSLVKPWWVDETENMLLLEAYTEKLSSITEEANSSTGGQLIGGLVALQKAPLATVIAVLFFLLPLHL